MTPRTPIDLARSSASNFAGPPPRRTDPLEIDIGKYHAEALRSFGRGERLFEPCARRSAREVHHPPDPELLKELARRLEHVGIEMGVHVELGDAARVPGLVG